VARDALEVLKGLQSDLVADLARAKGFEVWRLAELERIVKSRIAELEAGLSEVVLAGDSEAAGLGKNLVAGPLRAGGLDVAVSGLDANQLRVAKQISAEYVTNLADEARTKITNTLRLGVLGEKPPMDILAEIGRSLKSPSVFGKIATRAEMIARHEIGRAYSMAGHASMQQAHDTLGDRIKHQWLYDHISQHPRERHQMMHGEIAGVNEAFSNGLMYPRDPAAPLKETIGCG
jgi:hypothetical protein